MFSATPFLFKNWSVFKHERMSHSAGKYFSVYENNHSPSGVAKILHANNSNSFSSIQVLESA